MTINEACIKVLTELGGRAPLKLLCAKVQEIFVFKGATPYNSICTELINHPKNFRRTEGKKGWWELVSYQEEVAGYKKEISELKSQIAAKDKEIEELKKVKTEDEFVAKFVKKVKHHLKRDKKTVEEIRKLMDAVGRPDADKELDDWLQGKDTKVVKKVTKKYIQKNINSQVFTGNITESEFNGSEANEEGRKEETDVEEYDDLSKE